MRTPQHDGRREPLLLDVLAECVQLIGRHEREQLGRGVDLQCVAPAFGHAAPPRWRRTGGGKFANARRFRFAPGRLTCRCLKALLARGLQISFAESTDGVRLRIWGFGGATSVQNWSLQTLPILRSTRRRACAGARSWLP